MHIDSLLQENIQNINFARRIWGNQYRKHFKSLLAYDLLEKTVGQQSADCWLTDFLGGAVLHFFWKSVLQLGKNPMIQFLIIYVIT